MSMRELVRSIAIIAMSLAALGSAHAATIPITPGPNTNVALQALYGYEETSFGTANIDRTFNFTVASSLSVTTDAETIRSNGAGEKGVSNLVLTWYDAADSIVGFLNVTNAAGVTFPGLVPLVLTLTSGSYRLVVSGSFLANGGTFSIGIAATPLPPALILFATGLLGMTLLGRRRRANQN